MEKKHKKHLKTRVSKPFNLSSKFQEDDAKVAADLVWEKLVKEFPNLEFYNLTSLGLKGLDADFCVKYINRGYERDGLPSRDITELQAYESASGIKPDGGVFFVKSKDGSFLHIVGALEVKHQGDYTGYTPLSNTDWKKRGGDVKVPIQDRPPQAQGNAIERFAKNANAIKTLTSYYKYNPYVVFCEGFDFHRKEDYEIFSKMPYAERFKDQDSSIMMRLIAGNDWLPLNKIYVDCLKHGEASICPATIMARMPKWSKEEIVDVMFAVISKSLAHLRKIGEL